jgi:hypothetical protein
VRRDLVCSRPLIGVELHPGMHGAINTIRYTHAKI